jgi:galactokinase
MKIFVPGRICLFGEHSDWAGGYRRINADIEKGYTLITGTNQGIYAEAHPHPDSLVMSATDPDGERIGPYTLPMKADLLLNEAQKAGFGALAGVATRRLQPPLPCADMVIDNYKTDLPIKKIVIQCCHLRVNARLQSFI